MRRCRVGDAGFTAEDAIQDALLEVWRRYQAGTLQPATSLVEFDRRFPVVLQQVIIDRGRRDRAGKRQADGIISLSMLDPDIAEAVGERAVGPEQVASGKEQVRTFLGHLRRRDRKTSCVPVSLPLFGAYQRCCLSIPCADPALAAPA